MQFAEGVLRLTLGLVRLGVEPGHVVAIAALNCDSYLEWLLAIACAGAIAAPFNYRWSLEEAKLAMDEVKPIMLVTDTTYNFWHSKFHGTIRWHVCMSLPSEFNRGINVLTTNSIKTQPLTSTSVSLLWAPRNAALICFTSGSSGRPKGVVLSHSSLIVQSLAKLALIGYREDDMYLHTVPLCHIGGISSALAMLMVGGCHVFVPKFASGPAIRIIEKLKVTSFITVPAIMADLISLARTMDTDTRFEGVKRILNGGGGLSPSLVEDVGRFFPRTTLISAYGMTEACSSLTFMTLYCPTGGRCSQLPGSVKKSTNSVNRLGGICVGKPAPHVELKIQVNDDSTQVGNILTRGPHLLLGYWGQTLSEVPYSVDGWFDTCDIGQVDEYGNLWLIGRSSGRIKTGGENVYPEEVEAVILQHPGISGVVVTGLPDIRLTESVVACIQLKDNWQWIDLASGSLINDKDRCLSKEIIQQFCCDKNLTGFKIPRTYILWSHPFPTTTTGKVRRDQVKKEAISLLQSLSSKL